MDWPFLKHYADCTFPGPSSSPFPRHCDKCSAALTLVVGRAFLLGAYPPAVCVCVRSACSQGMQCCTSFILAHYSLELLYIHPESTQFSNWWEFCSLFPGIATLTNLHYLFLKPSLYWLWFLCHFYLIIWFVNYWTLYSWWKVPLPSLSLECSFRVCVWKWLDLQSQPYSLRCAMAICSRPRWHPPCVWLPTVCSREAVKVSVCLPSLWMS